MPTRLLILFILSITIAGTALAGRLFPENGKRGVIKGSQYHQINISGKVYRLSPGGKIFDQWNRIILPATVEQNVDVFFLIDMNGDISKIWLLTNQELAELKKAGR